MASDYDKAQHRAEFHARELAKAMDELIGDAPGWTVVVQQYRGGHPLVDKYRLDDMNGINVTVHGAAKR
jgi:hypothetical protein